MSEYLEEREEQGFTLIELLIAIVVVGVLTAVAIVGIASLTNQGEASACKASVDAAKAAQAVYYANNDGTWPADVEALTGAGGELDAPSDVTVDGLRMYSGDDADPAWDISATVSTSGALEWDTAACEAA